MEEIRQEKERETRLITNAVDAFTSGGKKSDIKGKDGDERKSGRNNRWKMVSMKMLSRKPSSRDLTQANG